MIWRIYRRLFRRRSDPDILGHDSPSTPANRGTTIVAAIASTVLHGLVPEIFQRRKSTSNAHANSARASTAWLDGLRGWAAFLVCMCHLSVYTHLYLEMCHGGEIFPNVVNTTPATLPFFRLMFSGGHFSVMIFFTISGYVLTKKLTSLLQQGRRGEFLESLHSAVCRRPLRLFLPVLWSTLFLVFLWHITGIQTPWPVRESNVFAELLWWTRETFKFLYFFRDGALYHGYNFHTWTIPVELKGSMLVFVWLFAMHKCTTRTRILINFAALIHLVFFAQGATYACFMAGMFTAELDLFYDAGLDSYLELPWNGMIHWLRKRWVIRGILMHLLFVVALYLGGQPTAEGQTSKQILGKCYGWETLEWFIPAAYEDKNFKNAHRWYWLFWASWLLVLSINKIRWLRRAFEGRFSQYLGRISFLLYLTHGPMIGLLSERLFYLTGVKIAIDKDQEAKFGHLTGLWSNAPWWPFPTEGPHGLEPNFLFCVAVSLPIFLYVAELATKMFDTPSVKVSRWAYLKTIKDDGEDEEEKVKMMDVVKE